MSSTVQQQPQGIVARIQDKVERIYYAHGLLCASRPALAISVAFCVILFCCYPLIYIFPMQTAPLEYSSRHYDYAVLSDRLSNAELNVPYEITENSTEKPPWLHGRPLAFVQQVIMRSVVSPWQQDFILTDAFRTPVEKVFNLIDSIRNFQPEYNRSVSLSEFCLHVTEPSNQKLKDFLPHYGCLIVSPANVWQHDLIKFQTDPTFLNSISRTRIVAADARPTIKEILFGVPWSESGMKRVYVTTRQRVITYAVTIVLETYDHRFIADLRANLMKSYGMSDHSYDWSDGLGGNITHIYFDDSSLMDLAPLFCTYVILFFYIYFSVRKIELVKSKFGMALSAVTTVVSSFCMSIGICTWFGLSFTLMPGQMYLKEIFPYIVVIIGLENILVLTKSVVLTPVQLDVKVRVAQGLSKEGWAITKNLLVELALLTLGFFTFSHSIQEFCMYAIIGLLSDFFLQHVFFATVLAIDFRRMELSDLQRQSLHQGNLPTPTDQLNYMYPLFRTSFLNMVDAKLAKTRHLNRNLDDAKSLVGSDADDAQRKPMRRKVPRRVRIVYYWARCRFFQRLFMVAFVIWMAFIGYRSGVLQHILPRASDGANPISNDTLTVSKLPAKVSATRSEIRFAAGNESRKATEANDQIMKQPVVKGQEPELYKESDCELWRGLLYNHWPTLFRYYNISMRNRYVSLLPPIQLGTKISPDEVVKARHPEEVERAAKFDWLKQGQADLMGDTENEDFVSQRSYKSAFYPDTPGHLLLTVVLAIPSFVLFVYLLVTLYKCMCSRNYAEWRSSWDKESKCQLQDTNTQLVMEAMPIVLEGHPQEVECMSTDGTYVISTCLGGQVRIWDSNSGECLNVIDRKQKLLKDCNINRNSSSYPDFSSVRTIEGEQSSDYESGSPPTGNDRYLSNRKITPTDDSDAIVFSATHKGGKRKSVDLFSNQPDLNATIHTQFCTQKSRTQSCNDGKRSESEGFDFGAKFDVYYEQHRQLLLEEQKYKELSSSQIAPSAPASVEKKNQLSCLIGRVKQHSRAGSTDVEFFQLGEEHAVSVGGQNGGLSAVWCMDACSGLIVLGCGDGRIEFWDALSGGLKCVYPEPANIGNGVTGVRLRGNKIIAARITGQIDYYFVTPFNLAASNPDMFHPDDNARFYRCPTRNLSSSSMWEDGIGDADDIHCVWVKTIRAHQQPISVLQFEGLHVVTGSLDHTLKVFRVDEKDISCISTLHGHYGPISTTFIDKLSPWTLASGSMDGVVCLWDIASGACVCHLTGHDRAVTALAYTANYVLSAGTDDKIFIWERFQGHLLNTIHLNHSYCGNIIMLTDNLLLTGKNGSLVVWDIRIGEAVRVVRLGHGDHSVCVRQIQHVGHAVVCDYGTQLRVVRFPTILEKID